MEKAIGRSRTRRSRGLLGVLAVAIALVALGVCTASASAWWKPPAKPTWYWQLQGTINTTRAVEIYDTDYEETTKKQVTTLHEKGRHVICYVDVGGAENYRSDYPQFEKLDKEGIEIIGKGIEGWEEEAWINIRELKYVEPIMKARFETCVSKGFDAVEIDEDEAWLNETGLKEPITAAQQLTYNKWLAETIHSLGMAAFQKNDGPQTKEQVSLFDGVVAEQCNEPGVGEPYVCSNYVPYVEAGKPVLEAEYKLTKAKFCSADEKLGFMGVRFNVALNGKTFEPCP